ncbi:MAG: hypothetical protein F4Y22_11495 [Gammaproteobacteria bacterium]|nr:hypothetical protein [Gammaproteobacteria bacterium]MYH46223.1 hypothetical protein [Gammaproteobacteria bacterium]
MPSLKDVLESTLADTKFDLGKSEITRHGTLMTYEGRPDEIVTATELHDLATADSWQDERSAQARGAKAIASDEAMSQLRACLDELLHEFIDPDTGRIGHAFPMDSANRGSTRSEHGGVSSMSFDSPMTEFTYVLLRGCAIIGTEAFAEMLTGWIEGESVRYRTSAVLNGLYLEGSAELLPGIRLEPLPKSSDGAFGTTPIRSGSSIGEYLGRTVLSVDSIATPAFYRPKLDGPTSQVKAKFVPNVALDDICEALALESDGDIRIAFEWNDYGEQSLYLSPGRTESSSRGRGGLDGRQAGHSKSIDFKTGVESISIPDEQICKLSSSRLGALIGAISRKKSSQFRIALSRWCKSRESSGTISDQFIDLRVALEAFYLKKFKGEQNVDMTFRLALFGAWHLGDGVEERRTIRRTLRDVYGVGSRAVHGQNLESNEKNQDLLSEGQRLCRLGMLKVLKEGEPNDWEELILGDEDKKTEE